MSTTRDAYDDDDDVCCVNKTCSYQWFLIIMVL